MKYDKKTGKKIAENRSDEIKIALETLQKLNEKHHGLVDKDIEQNSILMDISISLGLLVDICAAIYKKLTNAESCILEDSKKQ